MTLIINTIGLLLIGLIIGWFWLSKPRLYSAKTVGLIEILVKDGAYQPAYIEVERQHEVTLRFLRKDPSPCAEIVTFGALNVSQQLPLNQPVDIMLKLDNPGEYEFTCQMGMYRGKLIIK
ncbi:MAG: cupredoxin domain-containing protein [Gammaproteobacteria bacterium]|nr:cupredoxin domain-containing protein [Gammaproteobacteria bacterium]